LRGNFEKDIAKLIHGLPFNAFDRGASTPQSKFYAQVVFDQLGVRPALELQRSWGFYRLGALNENDWDSDFLMNWNTTGVFTGLVPDYFDPSPSDNPNIAAARLLELNLYGPDQELLAAFRRPSKN